MRRLIAALTIALLASAGLALGETAPPASAGNPVAANQFVAAINGWRAAHGVGPLGVHSVLVAKAQAWADHMAATGCLCHSNLPSGITVSWTKLGENIGEGPSVGSLQGAFQASPPHNANMLDPTFHWIGVGVTQVGGTIWVAEEFMNGAPPPPPKVSAAALIAAQWHGRAVAARPGGGFWVLDGDGTVRAYAGAPNLGSSKFVRPLGRDIVAMPDGKGYATLDGYGGIHLFGSAVTYLAGLRGPWFPDRDIARGLALTSDGHGFGVLDGYGAVHTAGDAPHLASPYWRGWDIARSLAYPPGGGLLVLDGLGGVHASGGAHNYGSPNFGGRNIARDLAPWSDGKGYAIIDGFGGIHTVGSAKRSGPIPATRYDQWRGIVVQSGGYLSVRNDGVTARS
jgi:hypothetical protein